MIPPPQRTVPETVHRRGSGGAAQGRPRAALCIGPESSPSRSERQDEGLQKGGPRERKRGRNTEGLEALDRIPDMMSFQGKKNIVRKTMTLEEK